jgi:multidrug efflux pump subunit AcrB
VLERIRSELRGYPGTQVTVSKNEAGPPQGAPINIEVRGEDYEKIMADAVELKAFFEEQNIPGVEGLKLDIETGKPEMPILIDR